LDKIHRLSASGQNILRVDLETFEYETAYAVYNSFLVGNESMAYSLNVGSYTGSTIVNSHAGFLILSTSSKISTKEHNFGHSYGFALRIYERGIAQIV
jgi:ficolin